MGPEDRDDDKPIADPVAFVRTVMAHVAHEVDRATADRFGFVVSVNDGAATGGRFLGSGLLVDERHVLTCRHVVEKRSSWDLQTGLEVGFPGESDRVRVEAVRDDPVPLLDDKIDLAVLQLAAPRTKVAPVRFLVGVGKPEWYRLLPALRSARVLRSDGALPLDNAELSATFDHGKVAEIQVNGHGASSGFSGGGLLCPIAQYWTCLGVPVLGGLRAGFTKLISSDRVADFLNRLDVRFRSSNARVLSRVTWARSTGRDSYGRYASIDLAGVPYRLRWIPRGSLAMQSVMSSDAQSAELSGFWIGETACSRRLFEAVSNESRGTFAGDELPVVQVSWADCSRFLARTEELIPGLGLRLPTEAEWEYACRAGTSSRYSFGDALLPTQANLRFDGPDGHYLGGPTPVHTYPGNPFGLYQMHGNVWEWCSDWYHPYQGRPVHDPTGPLTGERRVVRGGAWSTHPRTAQSAWREAFPPLHRRADVGFRLARSAS